MGEGGGWKKEVECGSQEKVMMVGWRRKTNSVRDLGRVHERYLKVASDNVADSRHFPAILPICLPVTHPLTNHLEVYAHPCRECSGKITGHTPRSRW